MYKLEIKYYTYYSFIFRKSLSSASLIVTRKITNTNIVGFNTDKLVLHNIFSKELTPPAKDSIEYVYNNILSKITEDIINGRGYTKKIERINFFFMMFVCYLLNIKVTRKN